MRAVAVHIHNFRSIHDAEIKLKNVSLIAGANNAGKSNLIDAIRMFYGDIKWSDQKDKPLVTPKDETEAWVEIEYAPTSDELDTLKDEYRSKNGTFRVRNYFKSATTNTDGKKREGYYAYIDGKLSETLFYGEKNVGSGKLGKIVYIPAVSKVDEHTKLTGPSSLRDLVANVLSKVVANSPAYQDLAKAFTVFEEDIKEQQSEDGKSLNGLEQEITKELSPWETIFSLEIQNIQPDDIIKTLVKPNLVDQTHGGEIDQSRTGAGFQRNLIYTLIKLAAKYTSKQRNPQLIKKEFSPDFTWILFEEPEAFLHPPQEDTLYDSLVAITENEDTQVLLTTHSARFVSRSIDHLTRLIRLRRDNGVSHAKQLSEEQLEEFFDHAHTLDAEINILKPSEVDKAKIMSALKMELWLHPQRSAAFFSKKAILVEGPTEVGLYAYLNSRKIISELLNGVVMIDCMGKYNIHRFILLLNAFGIDHSVLYDGDGGESHDEEVTKAINEAKGEYTKEIVRLEQDVETLLGIPPLKDKKDKHKKPQYVLYHLEADLVKPENLKALELEFQKLCTFS